LTESPAALSIEAVHKFRRALDGRTVEILCGLSLAAPTGELTAIVGPSGGGKSTLVRLLNRLEEPDGGRILLFGEAIASLDPLVLRRRIGLVPQKPFMFEGSVLDNLQRPFHLREASPPAADSETLRSVLALCRLDPELLSRDARSLSLGQQQRVSLARTLVTGPEVLLLDEPTSALDRPTADRLAATLREICRSRRLTILMVTHDLRLAGRVADHLAYLEGGVIFEEGRPEQLLNHPRSEQLRRFLTEPETGEEAPA
jgi:putative ABC transport system ATP-binding protein